MDILIIYFIEKHSKFLGSFRWPNWKYFWDFWEKIFGEDEVLTSDPDDDFIEEEFEKDWSYEGVVKDLEYESV